MNLNLLWSYLYIIFFQLKFQFFSPLFHCTNRVNKYRKKRTKKYFAFASLSSRNRSQSLYFLYLLLSTMKKIYLLTHIFTKPSSSSILWGHLESLYSEHENKILFLLSNKKGLCKIWRHFFLPRLYLGPKLPSFFTEISCVNRTNGFFTAGECCIVGLLHTVKKTKHSNNSLNRF